MASDTLEDRDHRVLHELQKNSDRTNKDMAEAVGMTAAAFSFRKEKLKGDGYIKRINAVLDHDKLGLSTTGFVLLKFLQHEKRNGELLSVYGRTHDNILEIHTLFGAADVIVKMRATSPKRLLEMVSRMVIEVGASYSETMVVASTSLEDGEIVWPGAPTDPR